MGVRPPFNLPGCTYSVDEIPRRSSKFTVYWKLIHEFAFATNTGAQLIVPKNPLRIRAVLYAPKGNTATIIICGRDGQIGNGLAGFTAYNGLEMEPATGWEIDDTTDDIYGFVAIGGGDQNLRWYEAADDPRIPLVIAR
jgi:hypothetical protein